MAYFLFFYNIGVSFASLILCCSYASLYRMRGERVFLLAALLFGLYFLDIIVLYMYDYIPEFGSAYASIHEVAPYAYSLLSFAMLPLYRLVVGCVFGVEPSHKEAPLWIVCFVGAFCSWFVPDVTSSVAIESAFSMVLVSWIAVFSVRGLVAHRCELDRFAFAGVAVFVATLAGCEIAGSIEAVRSAADPSAPFRSLAIEVLGFVCMVIAVSHLAYDKAARRKESRAALVPAIAQRYGLTKREVQVLGLLAEGLSNREISEREFISVGTVKTHVHNVCAKLGVEGRGELPAFLKRELRETLRRGR